jgi:oxygen-independent coproporphyrinogen-3 oxidase
MRHVYVHVPFCARRCSYCDFSIAVRSRVPVEEYAEALGRELRHRFGAASQPRDIDTLYFGGGTPSKLGADGVARVMAILGEYFAPASSAEVTLEANPEDVTVESVAAWAGAGITRLSLGSQSFDSRVLAWMHRTHDADQIARAVGTARDGGIADLSLDLIFAVPSALERDWDRDLAAAIALEPAHLSVYGLTVEPATPLARWRDRGTAHEAPEELYEREFLRADDVLGGAGYEHYEVSNYSKPGHRARHNSAYWRGVPYLGLGPSSHGFDGTIRRWNESAYAAWVDRTVAGDPLAGSEMIGPAESHAEAVYLGLRTTDGLRFDGTRPAVTDAWVGEGWAVVDGDRIRLTPSGWLRMDALATALTSIPSR